VICISEHEKSLIMEILDKYAPNCEVLAFGSRVRGTHRQASDLDLAFINDGNDDLYNAKDAFMESDIPFRVDVVDYNRASPEFKAIIDKSCVKVK